VPGLGLAGAAYTGVGIPQVIASGQAAARQACAG
jgi:protoporphyrinogen oxidase